MDVILKQDVDSLGLRGEVVNVARGYARNFLLPRGLAETATPALVRELEKRDDQRARHEAKSVDEARAIAGRIEALELRFDVNAGPTGSLFGSVTATNVADRLWADEKIRVDRRKLAMDAIKRVGRFTVPVDVFSNVVAELKVVVAPEGQEPPEETSEEPPVEAVAVENTAVEAVAVEDTAVEDTAEDVDLVAVDDEPGPVTVDVGENTLEDAEPAAEGDEFDTSQI